MAEWLLPGELRGFLHPVRPVVEVEAVIGSGRVVRLAVLRGDRPLHAIGREHRLVHQATGQDAREQVGLLLLKFYEAAEDCEQVEEFSGPFGRPRRDMPLRLGAPRVAGHGKHEGNAFPKSLGAVK